MDSFIENYCGCWESESGYRLSIDLSRDDTVIVSFYRAGENKPMVRPWLDSRLAVNMVGRLDAEGSGTLDIELSGNVNGFCLNLYFDVIDENYQRLSPSIIRYEKEEFLDQYYELLGPLDTFKKC